MNDLVVNSNLNIPVVTDLDSKGIAPVLNILVSAVNVLLLQTKANAIGHKTEKDVKMREMEDELDEYKQRSLSGNIIISRSKKPHKDSIEVFKTEDELKQAPGNISNLDQNGLK